MKLFAWFTSLGEALLEEFAPAARRTQITLTDEERETIVGIALVLKRLKVYPHAPGRTQEDDVNLLFKIAKGRR